MNEDFIAFQHSNGYLNNYREANNRLKMIEIDQMTNFNSYQSNCGQLDFIKKTLQNSQYKHNSRQVLQVADGYHGEKTFFEHFTFEKFEKFQKFQKCQKMTQKIDQNDRPCEENMNTLSPENWQSALTLFRTENQNNKQLEHRNFYKASNMILSSSPYRRMERFVHEFQLPPLGLRGYSKDEKKADKKKNEKEHDFGLKNSFFYDTELPTVYLDPIIKPHNGFETNFNANLDEHNLQNFGKNNNTVFDDFDDEKFLSFLQVEI
jgi:hypothetical protein